jgi:hypothetical protein
MELDQIPGPMARDQRRDQCRCLHELLDKLPVFRYPFDVNRLPKNGIYFFYEHDERWGHSGDAARIVRIGTHRDGNFRSRIQEHFALKGWLAGVDRASLKDRSIFRKHVGRAILARHADPYLAIWDLDLIQSHVRARAKPHRDIAKEEEIESEVTRLLRERFWFRFILFEGQAQRMGSTGMESRLIGTVSACGVCRPSDGWLGRYSPIERVRRSGLWQVQHVWGPGLREADQQALLDTIAKTQMDGYYN